MEESNVKMAALASPQPAMVVVMDEGAREPRIMSWNEMAVGRHLLYAAPVQVAPAGWKLVPVEPTEAMFTRFAQQIETGVVYVGGFVQAYRCMLDAAPAAPMQPGTAADDARDAVLLEDTRKALKAWISGDTSSHQFAVHVDLILSAPAAKPADPAEEQGS